MTRRLKIRNLLSNIVIFGKKKHYPEAIDPKAVGNYPLEVFSGGGYFYDEVLEYRVWTKRDGKLECHFFSDYPAALKFSKSNRGAEKPLALVLQKEYVDEQEAGKYVHIERERIAEWQIDWLGEENRGSHNKIPQFLADVDASA